MSVNLFHRFDEGLRQRSQAGAPRGRRRAGQARKARVGSRLLRLESLEDRKLLQGEPLEIMPTSPFIVSPFIDPLVIPEALEPGWRQPDGTLAPDDPNAWSVRETHYAGATPTDDPNYPYISPPGPGVNQQDSIGFVPAIPGLFEQHEGQHQVWPNAAGQNSDRLVGEEGGPLPDPILYHIRLQVAEHDFTSSRVMPITPLGTPVPADQLPAGVVVDENGTAELPSSTIYGFNGTFPGPMINTEYGKPALVRFENDLDLNPLGLDRQDFGDPAWKFLTHLHNAHTAPESDGNPYYMQQNDGGYLPGEWSDNLYLNYPAGGDPNEKQSTFWFHDHVHNHTGENVYKGMVGLYPIYDPDLDPGDERDDGTNGDALHLPGIKTVNADGSFDVKYDIYMAFYDVALDDGVTVHDDMHTLPQDVETHPEWWGKSFYQHFNNTGLVGDIFTVNGTAFPVLHVDQRQYRFRFLDASVSRIYELALMTSDAGPVAMPGTQGQWQIPDGELWKPFQQIASMGGLLPESLDRDSVQIWPATRNEHVVDFRNAKPGDVIYLTNILEMPDGRKPNFNDPRLKVDEVPYKVPMVKIIVDGPPPEGEEGPTSVPSHLRPTPVLPSQAELDALPHPEFVLARSGKPGFEEQWQINDLPFDPLVTLHTVTRGQPEVWTVTNGGGGWVHPMHMHMEEHIVLSRVNSTNEHPDDTGKSDIANLDENESVTFYRNFRTFTGRYVAHCHNLLHEDHAMMFGWTIAEPPPTDVPQVSEFAKITDQDTPLSFTTMDFTDHFTDPNVGETLQAVQIVTTPMYGVLQVNSADVVAGQQIVTADLATLVYVPAAGYAGPDRFTWDGSDGTQYSGVPAMVSLLVDPLGSDLVTQWNLLVLGLNLPHGHEYMGGRLQAMMHAAIYDAVMALAGTHPAYHVSTPPPAGASMEAAATAAAYQVLYTETTDPRQRALIQARLDDHLAEIPDGQAKAAGIAFGQSVGEAIMLLRATDGAMMALLADHADGTLPGQWRRTASGAPLAPGWGEVTPWVMASANQFDQGGPPALGSPEYAADYEETRLWGAGDSTLRTADQTATVMFWEHHPQPKWYKVARDISNVEDLTLAENAQLFHLLSMTMADATIATWDTKFRYSFWRPETAIHLGDTDGNDATAADAAWQSLIASPAFPEYFSGHSTQSASAAKLLELFFGRGDYTFQLTAMGMPARTYDSFQQAAEEAGASRVYGGIHFQFSNQDALQAGSQLASYVYATLADETSPTVTINQAAGQADPANASPINFTVVFSEPVLGFGDATDDVTLGGTAGAAVAAVTETGPLDGTTYNVAVSGMTGDGTVIVNLAAGVAQDAGGNLSAASTSSDNSVQFVAGPLPQAVPYFQDFAAGQPGADQGWEYFSTGQGRIRIVNGRLQMDDRVRNAACSLNEAVLHVNLEGRTNVQLQLGHGSRDERHRFAGTQFTGHRNADLMAVSVDGTNWVKVMNLTSGFGRRTFALDVPLQQAAAAAGSNDLSNVRIKLQQYDNAPWGVDGRWFDNIRVTGVAGAPLLAASAPVSPATSHRGLDQRALQPLVEAAIAGWTSQGLPAELVGRLRQTRFVVTDLPGSYLAMAAGNTVYLDADAAGNGWFIDRTPSANEEFRAITPGGDLRAIEPRAVDRIDLMTVVSHELGHVAGWDDLDARPGSLMSRSLPTGIRRNVRSAAVDTALQSSQRWS